MTEKVAATPEFLAAELVLRLWRSRREIQTHVGCQTRPKPRASLPRAQILWWNRRVTFCVEGLERAQGPVGIAQELARQQHQIGAAVADDVVGLHRFGDHADRGGRNVRPIADGFRKRHLITRARHHVRLRRVARRTAIDQVDAAGLQQTGQRDRIVESPAAGFPVSGGNAHGNRFIVRPLGAGELGDFQKQPRTILEAAAVLVAAMIRERRVKAVQKVSVCRVDFQPLKAGVARAPDRRNKRLTNTREPVIVEWFRSAPSFVEGNRARAGDWPSARFVRHVMSAFPWTSARSFSAGVGKLYSGHRAVSLHESRDPRQWLGVRVGPDPHVMRRNAADCFHGGRLDDHQRRAADGARSQMHKMPVGGESVLATVLAHRRYSDAIPQAHSAKRDGFKEMGHVFKELLSTDYTDFTDEDLACSESVDQIPSSCFASAKHFTANSRSSRVCAADTCTRIRALSFGTTGNENAIT